jgi:hypothetical protein
LARDLTAIHRDKMYAREGCIAAVFALTGVDQADLQKIAKVGSVLIPERGQFDLGLQLLCEQLHVGGGPQV